MYLLNKIGWAIFNPAAVGVILLAIAVVLAFLRIGSRRIVGWTCAAALFWIWLWSSSLPMLFLIGDMAEDYPEMRVEDVPQGDAIVDMGGGIAKGRFYPELHESADRALHSSRLWKAGKAPVIIPSGKGIKNTDVVFLKELGVPDDAIIVENEARNTEENAKFVSKILAERHKERSRKCKVLIVTSMWHMRRSMLMFKQYAPELEVIPVSTDGSGISDRGLMFADFLPDPSCLLNNSVLWHEVVGYYWYKFFR